MKWFFIYPLFSLINSVTFFLHYLFKIGFDDFAPVNNLFMNFFLLIEFLSIFIFIYKTISNVSLRKKLQIILLGYAIATLSNWLYFSSPILYPNNFVFVQSIFVVSLGVLSLINFFKGSLKLNLLNEPALWVTTGTFLYFLCTIPLYAAGKFILDDEGFIQEPSLYSINYLCYSILFILIIRAFLCNPAEKSSFS